MITIPISHLGQEKKKKSKQEEILEVMIMRI